MSMSTRRWASLLATECGEHLRAFALVYKEKVGHDIRKITYEDDNMPAFYTVNAQSMDTDHKEGALVEVGVRKVLIYEKKGTHNISMPEELTDEDVREDLRLQQLRESVITQLVAGKLCTRNGLPVLTSPVMEEFREYPYLSHWYESYYDGLKTTITIYVKIYFHYVVGTVDK